jgi:hypothetical protein
METITMKQRKGLAALNHLLQAAGVIIEEFNIEPRQVNAMMGDVLLHKIEPKFIPTYDELQVVQ